MGVPQQLDGLQWNNPLKFEWLGVPPILGNLHIFCIMVIICNHGMLFSVARFVPSLSALNQLIPHSLTAAGAVLWLSCVEVHSNVRGSLNWMSKDSIWMKVHSFQCQANFSDISVDILPNKWFEASWNCQIESQDSSKNSCWVYKYIYIHIISYYYILVSIYQIMLNRIWMGLICHPFIEVLNIGPHIRRTIDHT